MSNTSTHEIEAAVLGRREHELLTAADRRAFAGQRVLVTGAGGDVGAQLVRRLAACGPERITLFDHAESRLLEIEDELQTTWPHLSCDFILGDVMRLRSIRGALRATLPDAVYHAAGYTNVAATERSTCAVIESNVFGTQNVLTSAWETGARLVAVSSAKAARPLSVVGAAQRLAELIVLTPVDSSFRAVVVRLGTLVGGRGAPVGEWWSRIRRGQALRIAHLKATRHFMTRREAAMLAMKADLLGQVGETYWLSSRPEAVERLALRTMALAIAEGLPSVPIVTTGLPPGEGLDENPVGPELAEAGVLRGRIWSACHWTLDSAPLQRILRALRHDVTSGDALSVLADLHAAVPDFEPSRYACAKAAEATSQAPAIPGLSSWERHLAT